MSCQRFRTRLSAYLDEELQVPERDAVRRHLGACPACSLELRRLEGLSGFLEEIRVPEMPEALTRRILIDAASTVPVPRSPWWALARSLPLRPVGSLWLTRAAACALLLLGIATGSFLGWETVRSSQPPLPPQSSPPLASAPAEGTIAESVYGLDVFDGAPAGSIEGAYAELVLPAEGASR